jgi:aquaglyceroporin related protein
MPVLVAAVQIRLTTVDSIGVMLGVYVGGKSGGHLNPAVTLANCVYRGHPWRKFPVYMLAQILGAMTGAAIVYGNYRSAFDAFEGGSGLRTVTGPNATAGVFCTYPAAFMTRTGMFFSEVVASTILQFVIFAMADSNNIGAGPLMPLCLFFLIFGIGACFGWETGYAINLARDFGPRLVSYMIGYGHEVWSAGGYYFWVRRFRIASPRWLNAMTNVHVLDPHGCPILRLPSWRWSVRPLHLYW